MPLEIAEHRIFPVRGLVLLQNIGGRPYRVRDVERWIRLDRLVYKTPKIDVLAHGPQLRHMPALLDYAARHDARLSLRTLCDAPPPDLDALKTAGLYDLFLCPKQSGLDTLQPWLEAGQAAGLPIRVQLQAPFDTTLDAADVAQCLADAGVYAVNVAMSDPFLRRSGCRNAREAQANVEYMNALVREVDACGVEANLLHLPLCLVDEANLKHAVGRAQCSMDHQHYDLHAYYYARRLRDRWPWIAGTLILSFLWRETLSWSIPDHRLISWLIDHPSVYIRAAFYHKLTRVLRGSPPLPKELDPTPETHQRLLKAEQRRRAKLEGRVCAQCRLRRLCNLASPRFKQVLPGLEVKAQPGDLVVSPWAFSKDQPKHYDAIDAERLHMTSDYRQRAQAAAEEMRQRPPSRTLGGEDYRIEHAFFEQMEGGVRWHSIVKCEKKSSVLGVFTPPFTLSVTFAGGLADYIGFAFDTATRLMCPMEAFRHEVSVHVDADGRYVLLRDGEPVWPLEFWGAHYVPRRLPDRCAPRIACWNIDGSIVTHLARVWEGPAAADPGPPVKYSIVVVCTRYARRLQAALCALAHQRDFDMSQVEIVIAYVPGLDAVDDVLDSMREAFPGLRFVRATFTEQKATSKGFMINACLEIVRGAWTVLMDADTLLPPDFFAKADPVAASSHFIAPDGRKMLDKALTAQVLLGEIRPWEQWDELLKRAGEYRRREARGVPIGFCQLVKTECARNVMYAEVDHFEYSDMKFGEDIRAKYGRETWLTGVPVLHLDHGGSQWYGTPMHR